MVPGVYGRDEYHSGIYLLSYRQRPGPSSGRYDLGRLDSSDHLRLDDGHGLHYVWRAVLYAAYLSNAPWRFGVFHQY